MTADSRAVDTSVAVPLLLREHGGHEAAVGWARDRRLFLSGHAVAETYSVLTRLPGRLDPAQAARVMQAAFAGALPLHIDPASLPGRFAELGVAGGAVYDALVALAALEHGMVLATRDGRAKATYELMGVGAEVVP